jgi:diadenosine tetraphosphate (Ap4A) HIT family hydrolase
MILRPWDPENLYPGGVLKEYEHWVLEVSYRQHTLGSFIIFARREVERISDLEQMEIVTLRYVMRAIEVALTEAPEFHPDRFNYWQMGNALHRLHVHGIPRYQTPREFAGKTWTDTTWGSVPIWSKSNVDQALVESIRKALVPHI